MLSNTFFFSFPQQFQKPLRCETAIKVNFLPSDKIVDWSNLKASADDKTCVTEKLNFVLGTVEKIMGKGENAGYQHFLLFP